MSPPARTRPPSGTIALTVWQRSLAARVVRGALKPATTASRVRSIAASDGCSRRATFANEPPRYGRRPAGTGVSIGPSTVMSSAPSAPEAASKAASRRRLAPLAVVNWPPANTRPPATASAVTEPSVPAAKPRTPAMRR